MAIGVVSSPRLCCFDCAPLLGCLRHFVLEGSDARLEGAKRDDERHCVVMVSVLEEQPVRDLEGI
jgi:hypothetical protein